MVWESSTKGQQDYNLLAIYPSILNEKWYLELSLKYSRNLADQYYGLGNATEWDETLDENKYYKVESRYAMTQIISRYSISEHTSLILGGTFRWLKTIVDSDTSACKLSADNPIGYDGGYANGLLLGIIYDKRDNEYIPTKGFMLKSRNEFYGSYSASDYEFTRHILQGSIYQKIYYPIFALRGNFLTTSGDVPFFEKPFLGGSGITFLRSTATLRGYLSHRFLGNSSVFTNAELRMDLFEHYIFGEVYTKTGLVLFTDAGRVWIDEADYNEFFKDWHYTYGAGIRLALNTELFIISADVGISEETSGLYIGLGHTF